MGQARLAEVEAMSVGDLFDLHEAMDIKEALEKEANEKAAAKAK